MPHRLIITLVMTPCVGGITGGCQGATPFIGAAHRWVGVEEPNSGCCCWSLGDACQGGAKRPSSSSGVRRDILGCVGVTAGQRGPGGAISRDRQRRGPWRGVRGHPPFRAGACHRVALLGQGWVLGLAWWQEQPWVAAPCASSPCLGGRGSRSPPGSPAASTPRRTRAQGAACVWEGDPSPVLCAWRSCQHPVCSLFVLMAGARPS